MPRISSRQNPIVSRFRAAAARRDHELILLDGIHLIAEAHAAGIAIEVVAVSAEAEAQPEVAALGRRLVAGGADLASVTASVLDALSPVRSSSGIVALAHHPPLDTELIYRPATPLVAIAIDVQDPGNLGAIVRVAEAAGASGVISAGTSADPFGWKALRGAMGSAFRLPVARSGSAAAAIDGARRHGCRVVATSPRGGRELAEARLSGPLAVLIGGEGAGLADSLLESADERVTIPMQPPVESLNAAVTAALVLYEARRQRKA